MGFPDALEVNNPSANAINIREVGSIPGWGRFPGGLGLTGLISFQFKGLSRVFSNTIVQSINCSALSFLYIPALTGFFHLVVNWSLTLSSVAT